MKISKLLYDISRKTGKTASSINDINTLLTFDAKKIVNRMIRKEINSVGYKILNKINKSFR